METIKLKDYYRENAIRDRLFWQKAMDYATGKVLEMIPQFKGGYPAAASVGLKYPKIENDAWTTSFYTGLLWLSYLETGKEEFRNEAASRLLDFQKRLDTRVKTANHDLGFLYTLSARAEYQITGNPKAREVALQAARMLMERYIPEAGIFQAWGEMDGNELNGGRIIIDCLMNMPLLFWASNETGNPEYRKAALSHLENSRYLIRDDDTTFHTFYFDIKTGAPLRGKTHQGFSDDSCWARGQAWGIYGFLLNYLYTGNIELVALSKRLAHRFLNMLPEDNIPYWDLVFTSGQEPRDSSAAAIAACGLMLLSTLVPLTDPDRETYENAALTIMRSLAEMYTTAGADSNGILLHATQALPQGKGIDECNIFGDYYYMEALDFILNRHPLFW